jgi:hypothetical protein
MMKSIYNAGIPGCSKKKVINHLNPLLPCGRAIELIMVVRGGIVNGSKTIRWFFADRQYTSVREDCFEYMGR